MKIQSAHPRSGGGNAVTAEAYSCTIYDTSLTAQAEGRLEHQLFEKSTYEVKERLETRLYTHASYRHTLVCTNERSNLSTYSLLASENRR